MKVRQAKVQEKVTYPIKISFGKALVPIDQCIALHISFQLSWILNLGAVAGFEAAVQCSYFLSPSFRWGTSCIKKAKRLSFP